MPTVPFFQHELGQAELDAVAEVLTGPILTTGATVARLEQRFADYLGCRHAFGVTSCTGGLHMALLALGIGPGDEVITTPMTFVATATAILEAGARPVFVDVEAETGNLDVTRIEAAISPRTRAILPVHLYGQMCDMRGLRSIADRHGLVVVEDSAHCVEGERDGVRPGQLSEVACFSFYATKSLTCGEGGAVVTNRSDLADRLQLLRLHGVTKTAYDRSREGYAHWDMVSLGWKYNMDNIQAALLLPQLSRLDESWKRRHAVAERYEERLLGVKGLSWPGTAPGVRHAWHLFTIWVEEGRRDEILSGLGARGIGVSVHYRPVHLTRYFQETFGYRPGMFPEAERIGETTVSLPTYPSLSESHLEAVVGALKALM